MTPEEYRILFGEDPPDERDPTTAAPPSTAAWTDTRAWWRKKRFQFPASILLMITLLAIDNEPESSTPPPGDTEATPTASP